MNNFAMKMYVKYLNAKQDFLQNEVGAMGVVETVILIGAAVVLAILFKDRITEMINGLLDKLQTKVDGAI